MKESFMNRSKRIVITGASGFLGRHLLERIKNDGRYEIFALSSRPDELKKSIGEANAEYLHKDAIAGKAEFICGSVVINCAYPRNTTGMDIADGLRYIKGVFEAAAKNGAAAVINISSQSVYSQLRTDVATEETPLCLESPYAIGKYSVELMLESICGAADVRFTNLRMASLIGPGFDQRIVNRFAKRIIAGEAVTVMRQQKTMGFLDVEDAVSAIMAVADKPADTWKPVYNVGNGIGYTVEEIYETAAQILKDRMTVNEPVYENGNDSSCTAVSYDLLNADTGFVPAVDLKTSVERIIRQIQMNAEGHRL